MLFRASLERGATADYAAGDREPLVSDGVRFDSAAVLPPNARLTYDARANMYAEQGTVSFWWRPDQAPGRLGFPLFAASYEQHGSWDFNFAWAGWTGSQLSARIRDRNMEYHAVRADFRPKVGQWTHVAMTWSESGGIALYVDGKLAARSNGPLALDARLDQFGFLTRAITPHHTAPNEDPGAIRNARIYRVPLDDAAIARLAANQEPGEAPRTPVDWKARFGWNGGSNIPAGTALRITRIPVRDAKDLAKMWLKGTDGKRETLWPMVTHGYAGEGKTLKIWPEHQPVNVLRTTGNLEARFSAPDGLTFTRPAANEVHYKWLPKPVAIERLTITRQSGELGDLEFLHIEQIRPPKPGALEKFAPASDASFSARRDPETFTVWKPAARAAATAPGGRNHYFVLPVATDMAINGVRLRITSTPGVYHAVAVEDPVNPSHDLIETDVRAQARLLDLTLEFPDVLAPAGKQVVVRLASSAEEAPVIEARLLTSRDPESARKAFIAERIFQIRDSFQMLSEARPWMMIGRTVTLPQLRRQLKLIDELYTLLQDVKRVDPNEPVANGYWSWMNRMERPPAFKQPEPADPSIPLWAHRQLFLVKQFREVVNWWIDNRQIDTGEIGGGLGDDTDMIQNWPGVAFLDGPADKIRRSARRVLEACYAQGMITNGMNTMRTDALHAYEEGMNAYGPSFLLDYGNPVLFERMMQTASHYTRLTGTNSAGHRHFRSYQYSATDLVEEGYHAREDMYSHLILHPGLYVAWYNGLPSVKGLLREIGDSLLAHWQSEQYPRLAKGIFFATDEVDSRSTPNTETFNLLWGLYDIDRDPKYLWLLLQAVKARDLLSANSTNGRWVDLFESSDLEAPFAAEITKRRVDDHNLQTDQAGTVARVLGWQAGGDLKLVEEAQGALVQHMAQNMYLYTTAEQFTDRIWIPSLSVQRERLGGVAHYRNHIYPGHALSWEETGGEVAALVEAARPDYLRVRAFNVGTQPRRVRARVWQLENGTYEVTVRGAGAPARTLALKRYSPVDLDLPPRRETVFEIRQVAKGRPLHELPDLAIAAEEIRFENGLEIPVHNIGAVPSAGFTVSVRDAAGKLIAERHEPGLAAPDDLQPKIATVRFAGVPKTAGLRITVSQDGGAEEICDENNRVQLP